jgi:5-formyltetrahydrofolate cyclo-ligase
MSVIAAKSELRKALRDRRESLTAEEIQKKSKEICDNFLQNLLPKLLAKKSDGIFSLYVATGGEVDVSSIAKHFRKNKIAFSYPKIVAKNQPLKFILAQDAQALVPSQVIKKVLEPVSGKEIVPDFLILPLLAFDADLSRLGMGGGFFDRTISALKTQKSEIITTGLGYGFQRLQDKLPIEKTDQRLDFIVTEKNVFLRS